MRRASNQIQLNAGLLRRFPPKGRYLVGVSGGRDSVALLHLLVDLGYRDLVVCHLNHQLRGRASDGDARFVHKLAAKCDVDLAIGKTNVRAVAGKKKVSVETAGRAARYKFFAQVANRRRCRTVFVGHHADDLVETFLLNLFRGAGPAGLAAMREVSRRKIDNVELTIVRPLLSAWRSEIDDYIGEHKLKFREDASNKDLSATRNRIRCRIIPYLEKTLGRDIRKSIWRAATLAAEEESWLADQLPNSNYLDLSVAKLRQLPVALQRRAILEWLRSRGAANLGFEVIENVRSLVDHARIAKVNLPQDRHVRRRAGKIFIE